MVRKLENYVCGEWRSGTGDGTLLLDAVTAAPIALAGTEGIDSLDKLPAKSKEQVKNLRAEADSLLQELDYADFAMNKWMPDFYGKADTLSNDVKAKISYLIAENEKATRITDAIVNGIRKADSLLRR